MTNGLEIRPARAEDRDAVFAFCAQTWDDGDYIPEVWDTWLADADGAFLAAVEDGRPVGIIHLALLSPQEAWLEGIRVDPAARRQGIGRELTARAMAIARERGAVVARLFTSSDNTASQAMVTGLGFDQVAAFVRYRATAESLPEPETIPPGATLRTASLADLDTLWSYLKGSNLVPLNGGLIVDGWVARALTRSVLETRLDSGDVLVLEAWGQIQALAVLRTDVGEDDEEGTSRLVAEYVDGMAEWIGRLARALRGLAARRGLERVVVALPSLLILHDAMDGAGFQRPGSHELWCYARQV